MHMRTLLLIVVTGALGACSSAEEGASEHAQVARVAPSEPLVIGETFTIDSRIMGEVRRINVMVPSVYGQAIDAPLPVLYMPDGGKHEDFLHVAGLVQVLVSNGGIRPFIVVGIENTVRRRDMTGPTTNQEDRKIAPVVGGSATFRSFIKDELMPAVRARYRTTDETAIVGESLAGLFVVETFFLEPDLFDSYIAFDPSLWWASEELVNAADTRLRTPPARRKSVFIASSSEPELARLAGRLAAAFESHRTDAVVFHYAPLPMETHATIYHPAALLAFRTILAPPANE